MINLLSKMFPTIFLLICLILTVSALIGFTNSVLTNATVKGLSYFKSTSSTIANTVKPQATDTTHSGKLSVQYIPSLAHISQHPL